MSNRSRQISFITQDPPNDHQFPSEKTYALEHPESYVAHTASAYKSSGRRRKPRGKKGEEDEESDSSGVTTQHPEQKDQDDSDPDMPSARTWPGDEKPTFNEEFMTSTSSTGNWGTEDEPIEEQGMWGWIGDGVTRVASVARGIMGLSIGNGEDQNATPVRTGENITQGSDRKGSKRPAEEEFTNETETSRRKKRVSQGGGGYGTSRRSG